MAPLEQLRFGRICSLIIGLASTFAAGLISKIGTIFDITQTLLGLFLGPLFACIVLAVMGVKTNGKMIVVGVLTSVVCGWYVFYIGWAPLWVSTITFIVCMAVSLIGKAIFGADKVKAD
jgi:hypothetical protein